MTSLNLPVVEGRCEDSPNLEVQVELSPKHDFLSKLLQPSNINRVKDYISWQVRMRNAAAEDESTHYSRIPHGTPISINLDPTSACNYACGHCVDLDILNTGKVYDHDKLIDSLDLLHKNGLKSVIVIGGGEPTLYPKFEELIEFIKLREMQAAVVTNGTGMKKIDNVGHLFSKGDWVRLSLDSGTDQTFQAMHKPKGKMQITKEQITLDKICEHVSETREKHSHLNVGFSYIITWKGAYINEQNIVPNIDEIKIATKLARDSGFSYISLKPFLTRASEGAEAVGIDTAKEDSKNILEKIKRNVAEAKKLQNESFKVLESTNLRVLLNGTSGNYMNQPTNCHMTFFRTVMGLEGIANCPVYRRVGRARIGDRDAYFSDSALEQTKIALAENIRTFDANKECKDVTCLYNSANWAIEKLVEQARLNPSIIDKLQSTDERKDYYL